MPRDICCPPESWCLNSGRVSRDKDDKIQSRVGEEKEQSQARVKWSEKAENRKMRFIWSNKVMGRKRGEKNTK